MVSSRPPTYMTEMASENEMGIEGITEERLSELVDLFYGRVRKDDLIGPVFNRAIDDWPEHLERLQAFWSSVMLTSGRYKGNPMAAHRRHAGAIAPAMFDRWLALWAEVTSERLPGPAAAALQHKAGHIAESLKLGLFFKIPPSVSSPSRPSGEGDIA